MSEPPRDIVMHPIGVIHTSFTQQRGTPIQGALAPQERGDVLVSESFREGLADLDGFSHIVLLYAFHRNEGYQMKVVPYLDDHERGLFATRAPRRPNPIGMTVVRLVDVDREAGRLTVEGVDMLDGTPLLDIKPHVPAFEPAEVVRTGWLETAGTTRTKADDRFER